MKVESSNNNISINHSKDFMIGGGEMGALTRAYDWESTPLGAPHFWPQSLRITLALMLGSKFPMFLWWGKDLIQFYNDAYRPSLGNNGKHPLALGQEGKKCWPEIWDVISPLIEQVFISGEATWSEDQLIPIYRNGKLEDVYWTFGYSAVRGEFNNIEGVLVICTENTEKVLSVRKLREQEQNLRNLILKAPVAMCVFTGAAYVVKLANDRMLEFWGKNPGEVMNKPFFTGLPEAGGQGFEELLSYVFVSGEPYTAQNVPIQLSRKGIPETVYFDLLYQPIFDEHRSVTEILTIVIDVTPQLLEQKKIQSLVDIRTFDLNKANASLQHTNDELKQFAYITSHHLQEPLRKIITFSKLLEKNLGEMGTGPQIFLDKLSNSAKSMSMLIKNILSYSELSKSNLVFQEVNLKKVLEQVISDYELLIHEKDAVIKYADLPVIEANPFQMAVLFSNLLSNALKYSGKSARPFIDVDFITCFENENNDPPGNKSYKIEFRDNGIGLDDEYAEQIFQIFERLHDKLEYEGTGIGLAMCKKIVQNHNGSISAKGNDKSGTVFTVILPAVHAL